MLTYQQCLVVFRDYAFKIISTSARGQWVKNRNISGFYGKHILESQMPNWPIAQGVQSIPTWRQAVISAASNFMSGRIISFTRPQCASPHKATVIRNFDIFYVVNLNKLINKQSSWWWFQTPRTSCDITIVKFHVMVKIIANVKFKLGPWALRAVPDILASTMRPVTFTIFPQSPDIQLTPPLTFPLLLWQRHWQQIEHIS